MHQIRQPAVAGAFYPAQESILARDVAALLSYAQPVTAATTPTPKAIIVPHAGYAYSGHTAALAYARMAAGRKTIHHIVLLGPVHRVPVRGLALPGVDFFATPLGKIEIDHDAVATILHLPQVMVSHAAHAMEHSLEVQLPFLQAVLDDFKLLPLAVGDASASEVAQVLETVWGGSETLIVVSSDLSHFLPYRLAQPRTGLWWYTDQRPAVGGGQTPSGSAPVGVVQLRRQRGGPATRGGLCIFRI